MPYREWEIFQEQLEKIRPDSIKQARWRLRSRLGLTSDDSLEEYLASLHAPAPE